MADTTELAVRPDDERGSVTVKSAASTLARRLAAFVRAVLMIVGVFAILIMILLAVAPTPTIGTRQRPEEQAAQSDLRNALTAENTVYTDSQTYSASTAVGGILTSVDSSLPWGTKITAVVGDAQNVGDSQVVCLSEASENTTLQIAEVATGPNAGTYFNKADDCSNLKPAVLARTWRSSW